MNICFACTRNYYKYLPTVLNSVLVNNPSAEVYVFAEDDSIETVQHSKVHIINVDKYPRFLYNEHPNFKKYTRMIVYKLAVTKILPDLDKCIFLDMDTLVDGDLTELWETNIDDKFYAMAQEWSTTVSLHCTQYFNAGVILMNLKQLKQQSVEDMLLNRLNMVNYAYPEQEVLNNWINGNSILELDSKWNFCITSKFPTTKPIIWHYQSSPKAWDKLASPYMWNKYYTEKLTDAE